ncbi:phosphoprotein ECPP44-like [Gastrolobium bilobum]|uniref:phosphoprotein ECPP44-like n=1 Tax=Gastrolobium bilobum TaxID=150636 RepID=UPI002AB149FE|nr:phosphoprotein ECPP44-like [Gastrolobium bilobum]
MAEENQNKSHEYDTTTEVEIQDRGVFDFLGKKKEEEKPQEEVIVTEFDKVKVSDETEGEKKHSLLEKLHRSSSSSSSSSDEEDEGEGGDKKKKKKEKKGLKEKIQEKIGCDHKEEKEEEKEDTAVPVEKVEVDPAHLEEKKGFLDKIKDKLPGQHKKIEEVPPTSSEYDAGHTHEVEAKEKKGLLEKIKEKLPGYHPKPNEEKEKESGAH